MHIADVCEHFILSFFLVNMMYPTHNKVSGGNWEPVIVKTLRPYTLDTFVPHFSQDSGSGITY